jgi:hypothetical protein
MSDVKDLVADDPFKYRQLHVYVREDMYAALREIAHRDAEPLSVLMRRIIKVYLGSTVQRTKVP